MEILIFALATWRMTSLLVSEEGPENILDQFRYKIGIRYDEVGETYGENWFAEAFCCFWCASVWIAFFLLPFYLISPYILLPLAMSGGAILIERVINGQSK